MSGWEDWYAGKVFSSDWSSHNFANWSTQLARFKDASVDVLEIGSWEGRSAILFLNLLPQCQLTCIDPFTGSVEHRGSEAVSSIEARFDANLAVFGARVEKIRDRSFPALDRLAEQGRAFDVIYIDGSHGRDDVLVDSLLSWKLLRNAGTLIWDDYLWGVPDLPEKARPQSAIDAFLALHADECQLVHKGAQLIVEKRATSRQALAETNWVFPRTIKNLVRFLLRQPMRSPRSQPPDR
jgi:predicted O-methyltransferase YrrM